MIRCTCPGCKASLELPDYLAETSFDCLSCNRSFVVPSTQNQAGQQSFMDRLLSGSDSSRGQGGSLPPPARRSLDGPTSESIPGSSPPVARPSEPPAAPRRPPEPMPEWMDDDRPRRRRDYYEDEEDEFDSPRRSLHTRESAARAAMMGMIMAMIGLIGMLAGIFVFMLTSRRGPAPGLEMITIVLLVAALLSFIFSLFGIVFSSRGLDRVNDYNRGVAVGGLVCGILGLVLSVVFGSFYFLCGVFLRMLPF